MGSELSFSATLAVPDGPACRGRGWRVDIWPIEFQMWLDAIIASTFPSIALTLPVLGDIVLLIGFVTFDMSSAFARGLI